MEKIKKWTGKPDGVVRTGFYITVDEVKYGPFLDVAKSQFDDLKHRKGVKFEPVCLKDGWISPDTGKTKPPRAETASLFDTRPYEANRRDFKKGWM